MSSVDIDELTDHIRRIAQEVFGRSQFKGTLVCTGYDKTTHSVKGIIQPHGIESGWVPLASLHVGNGFGIVIGPRVGSADKLDGQVFDVHFDGGDPDTLVAHHRQFSTQEKPPQVESGEMLFQHEKGHKVMFAKDGSVTIFHAALGGFMAFDPQGNLTHDVKNAVASTLASVIKKIAPKTLVSGVVHLATGLT